MHIEYLAGHRRDRQYCLYCSPEEFGGLLADADHVNTAYSRHERLAQLLEAFEALSTPAQSSAPRRQPQEPLPLVRTGQGDYQRDWPMPESNSPGVRIGASADACDLVRGVL